jgi:hypothetical protein
MYQYIQNKIIHFDLYLTSVSQTKFEMGALKWLLSMYALYTILQ